MPRYNVQYNFIRMTAAYMPKNNADLLRKRLRSLREAMPVAERQQSSAQLCSELGLWFEARHLLRSPKSEIVAGFWPLTHEPDLRPLFHRLHVTGTTVALPVVVKKHAPLEFHAWEPADNLNPGPFGVLEPTQGSVMQPTVLLVPTLGFNDHGERIGYGGGYYDRTLAALSNTGIPFTAIGIAWDQARLDEDAEHSAQPHDHPLDTILTPSGWVKITPKAKAL